MRPQICPHTFNVGLPKSPWQTLHQTSSLDRVKRDARSISTLANFLRENAISQPLMTCPQRTEKPPSLLHLYTSPPHLPISQKPHYHKQKLASRPRVQFKPPTPALHPSSLRSSTLALVRLWTFRGMLLSFGDHWLLRGEKPSQSSRRFAAGGRMMRSCWEKRRERGTDGLQGRGERGGKELALFSIFLST